MDVRPAQSQDRPDRRACIVCPNCGQGYRIAARLIGRKLACRHCRHEWRCTEIDPLELRRPVTEKQVSSSSAPPSDSTQTVLPEDLPPLAGSSSTVIDTSWVGRKLGRYRIVSVLGQGGMGIVWRGHDDTLRRDVALKLLNRRRRSTAGSSLNSALFMQEARAVAKLQHPHVVSIYEVGEDREQVFLALELMEGGTLKEYVDRNGAISPRELFGMLVGPVKALSLAHKRGIIHRDIKPGNLMFDDHGHLKLMDFGLADVAQEAASARMRGKAVGSLGWVAPETVKGQGTTAASDIYGMGLVTLFALMGKPWLHADSRSKLIALHQNPPEPDLSGVAGLTPRASQMLRTCLAVDPAQRFASAEDLANELLACAEEDPRAANQRRRSHASIAAVAAVFGLIIGFYAMATYFIRLADQAEKLSMPVMTKSQNQSIAPTDPSKVGDRAAEQTRQYVSIEEAKVPWTEVPELVNPGELSIIADKNGSAYHWASCEKGRQIWACNLQFFDRPEDAQAEGLKPCPLCSRPPGPMPDLRVGHGDNRDNQP